MTVTITTDKIIFLKYLLISITVSTTNVFFLLDRNIAMPIAFTEVLILLFFLLKRNLVHFISLYVIFITNCIEFAAFLDGGENFYNLKNIRIGGINLGVLILIPAVLVCLKTVNINKIKRVQPKFYFFSKNLLLLNIVAAIVGMLLIIINDNNIASVGDIFKLYLYSIYSMLFLPFSLAAIMYYIYTYTPKEIRLVSFSLEATLWGTAVQIIFAKIYGIAGYYGGIVTLLMSNISFMMPLIFLLYWDSKNIVFPKANLIIGIIANILIFMYNPSGKVFILLAISFCFFFLFLIRRVSLLYKYLSGFILIGLVLLLPIINNIFLMDNNVLYASKLAQTMSFFNIWDTNWYLNMPGSPRLRITELINVGIEYWNKPWLIFTGKGYLGSIKDYVNMFSSYAGAFSFAQWNAGVFYNLHEFSTQLLMFGLLGIYYSFKLILETLKLYKSNIWIIFGSCWFLVMYGYSFTISTFGIVALFYGLKCEET